jgi:hypothetical protein
MNKSKYSDEVVHEAMNLELSIRRYLLKINTEFMINELFSEHSKLVREYLLISSRELPIDLMDMPHTKENAKKIREFFNTHKDYKDKDKNCSLFEMLFGKERIQSIIGEMLKFLPELKKQSENILQELSSLVSSVTDLLARHGLQSFAHYRTIDIALPNFTINDSGIGSGDWGNLFHTCNTFKEKLRSAVEKLQEQLSLITDAKEESEDSSPEQAATSE